MKALHKTVEFFFRIYSIWLRYDPKLDTRLRNEKLRKKMFKVRESVHVGFGFASQKHHKA